MFNIFDQPWTMLTAAVIVLFIIRMLHRIFPDKSRWWHLLLPVVLVIIGFGLDWLVVTDTEKIKKLIKDGMIAVEQENIDGIDAIIAENYQDSYHRTKEDFMRHCRALLAQPLVEDNIERNLIIVPGARTTVFLTVITRFEEQSYVYQNYKHLILIKLRLTVQKQAGKWLITKAEITEIDNQRIRWDQIGYHY